MVRIKKFRPSCISGLDIHVCKEEWLSSRAADYVHGSIVIVDGGWMGR